VRDFPLRVAREGNRQQDTETLALTVEPRTRVRYCRPGVLLSFFSDKQVPKVSSHKHDAQFGRSPKHIWLARSAFKVCESRVHIPLLLQRSNKISPRRRPTIDGFVIYNI